MRRYTTLFAALMLALGMMGGTAFAKPVNTDPSDPQCLGHRTATHASGQNPDVTAQGNPAQRAAEDDRFDSVKDVMDHVKDNCDA